jgi:hypothetical protein
MTTPPFFDRISRDAESSQWKVYARNDQKVEAIKQFRQATGASLYDAKNVVMEYLKRRADAQTSKSVVHLPNDAILTITTNPDREDSYSVSVTTTYTKDVSGRNLAQAIVDAALAAYPHVGPAVG